LAFLFRHSRKAAMGMVAQEWAVPEWEVPEWAAQAWVAQEWEDQDGEDQDGEDQDGEAQEWEAQDGEEDRGAEGISVFHYSRIIAFSHGLTAPTLKPRHWIILPTADSSGGRLPRRCRPRGGRAKRRIGVQFTDLKSPQALASWRCEKLNRSAPGRSRR
jgi:hypothetical protein